MQGSIARSSALLALAFSAAFLVLIAGSARADTGKSLTGEPVVGPPETPVSSLPAAPPESVEDEPANSDPGTTVDPTPVPGIGLTTPAAPGKRVPVRDVEPRGRVGSRVADRERTPACRGDRDCSKPKGERRKGEPNPVRPHWATAFRNISRLVFF
jgi:hypothetical protein